MFLGQEQVAVSNVLLTVASLTIPGPTTHVQIQAGTNDVRYTMDNATNPTQTLGMIFSSTAPEPVYEFLAEDLQRIRFIRGAVADGTLDFHYSAGRNI